MPKNAELAPLLAALQAAAADLPAVDQLKMFGCDALFTKGNIFALVWKEGRIGVKLPDPAAHAKLSESSGVAPWAIGKMSMKEWLFVPVSWHKTPGKLKAWVTKAHALAAAAPAKAKKKVAKKAAKKRPGGGKKKKTVKKGAKRH